MRRSLSLITLVLVLLYGGGDVLGQLYVTSYQSGTVGKYDPDTGAPIDASFISAPYPEAVAIDGNHLFVSIVSGDVREYDASTGALINPLFVASNGDEIISMATDADGHLFTG